MRLADNSLFECPVVTLPDNFDEQLQSWDMAFKDTETSAFVVGQVWAKKDADKFLLDQARARLNFPKTVEAVVNLSAKWPKAIAKLVEDRANGSAVIQTLQSKLAGLIAIEPDGSKEARAHAVSPQVESGNVYLPHPLIADWVDDLMAECGAFPNASDADQVDSLTQALIRLELHQERKAYFSVGGSGSRSGASLLDAILNSVKKPE